jgi:hypothetical protein
VRVVLGEPVVISPLDPGNRELSVRRIDVNVRGSNPKTWNSGSLFAADDTVLTADLLWSGDFVNPTTRSSAGQLLAPVITNAALVAPAGEVSVAAALTHRSVCSGGAGTGWDRGRHLAAATHRGAFRQKFARRFAPESTASIGSRSDPARFSAHEHTSCR